MGARSKARKRAVDILYAAALRDSDPLTLHTERTAVAEHPAPDDYATTLLEGVVAHRERIDELLTEHAEGWTLDRMPPVDLAILRLGLFELLWAQDVPDPVAVDEAVQLAKSLSTDDSPRFVNGVLGRLAVMADHLRATL
ncbi:transcription antitermination factor NusB [Actinophytocola gossypii]|uniref:Transcription antitermination protein NusB n=1 Tax=Actinophytocola gossypii TaxID=2812003 RepID=A0ABT2J5U3_9PSEU|nr:transcription antitermination factor NusB [Actinophytocola gossypii]MCT2583238.1 transcription antitermination factor NusB [Actinophytocola gossypii]